MKKRESRRFPLFDAEFIAADCTKVISQLILVVSLYFPSINGVSCYETTIPVPSSFTLPAMNYSHFE